MLAAAANPGHLQQLRGMRLWHWDQHRRAEARRRMAILPRLLEIYAREAEFHQRCVLALDEFFASDDRAEGDAARIAPDAAAPWMSPECKP